MTTVSNGSVNTYSYAYYASMISSTGKIAVPVSAPYVMYAQLEHISGYASPQSSGGVSLNKVHLLNSLISHAATGRREQVATVTEGQFTEKQLDAMIAGYQSKIQNAVQAAKSNPYALVPEPLQGNAVNFVA